MNAKTYLSIVPMLLVVYGITFMIASAPLVKVRGTIFIPEFTTPAAALIAGGIILFFIWLDRFD